MKAPTIKQRMENLSALNESAKAIEALKIATRALEFYAKPGNWSEDDWGIKAVINPPDYTHEHEGGQKARNAIKRIERALRPGPCKALKED